MFNKIKKAFYKYDHIQIRYNTKNNGSPLVWRIIINGENYLAENVSIIGHCYGEHSVVDGDVKLNIACMGKVYWDGNDAEIKTAKYQRDLLL